MDVPEVMVRMIWEARNQPWQYYVDMGRQVWDEARHAMMGTVYLQHHGNAMPSAGEMLRCGCSISPAA